MNAAKQAAWLFFTLIMLAYSGWYFVGGAPSIKLDPSTLSTTIDATALHLTVRKFNTEGMLVNQLITPRMQHIPKGDIHLFLTPHIIITQDEKPAWDIQSQLAKSFDGGDHITFSKQVVVHQNPGDKTQESTLRTEEVTYFPDEKKATSDLLVTYEQPGNIVQSKGMIAFIDEKRVQLLHQARGSYVPNEG